MPVSLMAHLAPDAILPVLEREARADVPGAHDGRFLRRVRGGWRRMG
ncbi:MAG: hypothetical protein ACOCYW_01980 [Roseicyclus sp.]